MGHNRKKSHPPGKKRSAKAGLPPGTPVYTGIHTSGSSIERWIYTPKECFQIQNTPAKHQLLPEQVQWIRVQGLEDDKAIGNLAQEFTIHPLVVEDILHVEQLPKIEKDPDGYFIVTGIWSWPGTTLPLPATSFHWERPRQVSIIMKGQTLISFTETGEPPIDELLERIKNNRGIIRKQPALYGLYALLDVILDSYFHVCDAIEMELDSIEEDLENESSTQTRIQHLRKHVGKLRRYLMPLRESLLHLYRDVSDTNPELSAYFRDLLDHSFQIITLLENYRDSLMSLHDLFLSTLSHKMNRIMKVLTIISTIFLPLTFLAGVYGMNFLYMPELEMPWAYPATLGVMITIAVGMLVFFRRKKWL